MTTLIRDLIHIPKRVLKGDYSYNLTENINQPDPVLHDFMVIPQLSSCFDNALAFLNASLASDKNKPAYLQGKIGSGKPHFLAMLDWRYEETP